MPDSAILGKSKEALVKVASASSMELKDAEGKATGSELTLNLQVTNKSSLEAKEFFSVSSSDARLELDNGTSITSGENSGSTNPEPEASSQAVWSFQLLPNASPEKLNLFRWNKGISRFIRKINFRPRVFPGFFISLNNYKNVKKLKNIV